MKLPKLLLLFTSIYFISANTKAQENAAPSIHLTYNFPSNDAILKMQKIKIVQSAFASYFEVNSFTNGYAGLQQTPDMSYGNPNILISSLWDPNTAGGIYSTVDYNDPTTFKSRFGGEGDGWKTINPYAWQLNTWYNLFSNIVKIDIAGKSVDFKILPNPAKSTVSVNVQNLKQVIIINQLGKIVLRQALSDRKTVIDVSSLPKGIYTFSATDNNNKVYTEKIIIE